MKKLLLKLCGLLLVTSIFALGIFVVLWTKIPNAFDRSYMKGLVYQYRCLEKADKDEPKILVVGTSETAMSVDIKQLEKEMGGMPCYIIGQDASLCVDYLFRLIRGKINEGDIVIYTFDPETIPVDYTEYGMNLLWAAAEGEPDMMLKMLPDRLFDVIISAGDRAFYKMKFYIKNGIMRRVYHEDYRTKEQEGVYDAWSFDEDTGNLIYYREKPEIELSTITGQEKYDYALMDKTLIPTLNELYDYVQSNNATLLLNNHTIYENTLTNTKEELDALQDRWSKELKAPFLTRVEDNFVKYDRIFNYNDHVTSKGMEENTKRLAEALKMYLRK